MILKNLLSYLCILSVLNKINTRDRKMKKDKYSLPLPDLIGRDQALPIVIRKISLLSQIEKHSQGKVKICLSGSDLEKSFQERSLSVLMHIEGDRMY